MGAAPGTEGVSLIRTQPKYHQITAAGNKNFRALPFTEQPKPRLSGTI
jgi:hypothetical protein